MMFGLTPTQLNEMGYYTPPSPYVPPQLTPEAALRRKFADAISAAIKAKDEGVGFMEHIRKTEDTIRAEHIKAATDAAVQVYEELKEQELCESS